MNDTHQIAMLALSPTGTLTEVTAQPRDILHVLHQTIGCDSTELIRLAKGVDLWVDEDGHQHAAQPNLYATAVITALDPTMAGLTPVGTVVFGKTRRGSPAPLDDEVTTFITDLVRALDEFNDATRNEPAMNPVAITGGRTWEWAYQGVRFRAESLNGSPVVTLYFRTDRPDSAWTISHERATDGRSAKSVARDMFHDTTGVTND